MRRRLLAIVLLVLSAAAARAAEVAPDWARSLERVAAWLDASATNPPVVSCRLHVTEATGFPAGYQGAVVDVALQAPDRCRLGWGTNRTRVEFGRDGARLWVWEAATSRLVAARVGDGADGLRPGVGLPVPPRVLRLLPAACGSTNHGAVTVAGQRCTAASFWPGSTATWLGVEPFVVTLWSRQPDLLPVAARWRVPSEGLSLVVWPAGLRAEPAGSRGRWAPESVVPKGRRAVAATTDEPGVRRRLPAPVAFLAAELGAINAVAEAAAPGR